MGSGIIITALVLQMKTLLPRIIELGRGRASMETSNTASESVLLLTVSYCLFENIRVPITVDNQEGFVGVRPVQSLRTLCSEGAPCLRFNARQFPSWNSSFYLWICVLEVKSGGIMEPALGTGNFPVSWDGCSATGSAEHCSSSHQMADWTLRGRGQTLCSEAWGWALLIL